jgi:hypothetical protein
VPNISPTAELVLLGRIPSGEEGAQGLAFGLLAFMLEFVGLDPYDPVLKLLRNLFGKCTVFRPMWSGAKTRILFMYPGPPGSPEAILEHINGLIVKGVALEVDYQD